MDIEVLSLMWPEDINKTGKQFNVEKSGAYQHMLEEVTFIEEPTIVDFKRLLKLTNYSEKGPSQLPYLVVYKGFDRDEGIEIAWNQMSIKDDALQSAKDRERLLSEAVLLKSLKHDKITKCYCSWVDEEHRTVNMITELCSSRTLSQYRKKHKSVDLKAIKNWGRQILHGLNYLHTHNPPIVHRDLKGDNVFVNGNHGEVKIGDLGFATDLEKGTTRTVIGTPEYMAPELFEDDYNQLVDIYAFGILMIEMVTCEHPYSECKNFGHVYKKIISGVKPAALFKSEGSPVFGSCLSEAELLKDPFLLSGNSKEIVHGPSVLPIDSLLKSLNVPKPDFQISMILEPSFGMRSASETPSSIESWSSGDKKQFRLMGKRIDEKSVSFVLNITGLRKDKVGFVFDLGADTALSVASEMVGLEEFDTADVAPVADLLDSLLVKLVPSWKPSYYGAQRSHENSAQGNHCAEESSASDDKEVLHVDYCTENGTKDTIQYGFERCVGSVAESVKSNETGSSCSLTVPSVSPPDADELYGLKLELDVIESQYQQSCRQLLRQRAEAVEEAKKGGMEMSKNFAILC
ncbi:hypothetical protein RJ639_027650 [Escallonia herrerae]|uniref:non-specific serine/threonine protein kinase n=1 Tax=Escallonia herrerae TaxID=1293975 RepID=A0AA88X4H8_9ASTE|nr:hypothetical protein RJ639_027650 [Escallonia herrerae]